MSLISLDLPEAMRERQAELKREGRLATAAQVRLERERRAVTGERYAQRLIRRSYNASLATNLTADWSIAQTSPNSELRRGLRALRSRSRDLARNSSIYKKFLSMVTANVVGPKGISLRVEFDPHGNSSESRDRELADMIEDAWEEWGRPETASTSGKLSWVDQQVFAMRATARDGEFLCRELPFNNRFGYALNFRDVAWLDETYNTVLPGDRRVLMSVELDTYDRPIQYWLTRPTTDYLFPEFGTQFQYRTPVPAGYVIHKFLVTEDELQTRGVPWGHAAMEPLHTKDGYVDAELYAARYGASVTDYIKPPADSEGEGIPEPTAENPYPPGMVADMEAGTMRVLPPGYDVKSNDPKHPNTNFQQFWKAVMREIASGLEVSYCTLGNDLEGVNYSSIRAGLLEERDLWRGLQRWLIEHFCHRVFQHWLDVSMTTGAVKLSIRDRERVRDTWRPRGWDWVDPLKDVQAAILAINNGLDSRTDYCDERGEVLEDVIVRLGKEKKLMQQEGIAMVPPVQMKPTVKKETEGQDALAGEKAQPGAPQDDGDEEEVTRVLPIFESQLLPPSNGESHLLGD